MDYGVPAIYASTTLPIYRDLPLMCLCMYTAQWLPMSHVLLTIYH